MTTALQETPLQWNSDEVRNLLDALDARPLLDLDMRLGEGSGAALALPILRLACALHNGMATFAEAAVPDRTG